MFSKLLIFKLSVLLLCLFVSCSEDSSTNPSDNSSNGDCTGFSENFSNTNIDPNKWEITGNVYISNGQLVASPGTNQVFNYILSRETFTSACNIIEIECTPNRITSISFPISFVTHLGVISFYNTFDQWQVQWQDEGGNKHVKYLNFQYDDKHTYFLKIQVLNNLLEFWVDGSKIYSVDKFSIPLWTGQLRIGASDGTAYYDNLKVYSK